ncbi:MAG: nuclear transport factor 2 family protein [bacterium]
MTQRRVLAPLMLLALLAACAPKAFDAAEESTKLLKRDAEWSALSSAGKDTDAVAAFWSDSAVLSMEGVPEMKGRGAIRQFVAASFKTPGFNIHWKTDHVEFSPDGKMAYTQSFTMVTAPGPTGALVTTPGRGLVVWRLEADGQWRCVMDISNDLPVVAAAPAPAPAR